MAQTGSPSNAAMAARLERDVANLNGELNIAKRKLSSKSEALIILSADLDACRTERDQYKLMAEQLQSRHVAIKKQLAGEETVGKAGRVLLLPSKVFHSIFPTDMRKNCIDLSIFDRCC